MDTTLQDTLQRLEADRVKALEAFCAEQAKRIQELEEENARLKSAAEDFERTAEMWHGLAFDMAAEQDVRIGITAECEVGIVAECETALVDDAEEPARRVLGARCDARYPVAGNFLLDDRLDGHQTADIGCLDAPDYMPAGSHISTNPIDCYYTYVLPTISPRGGLV